MRFDLRTPGFRLRNLQTQFKNVLNFGPPQHINVHLKDAIVTHYIPLTSNIFDDKEICQCWPHYH